MRATRPAPRSPWRRCLISYMAICVCLAVRPNEVKGRSVQFVSRPNSAGGACKPASKRQIARSRHEVDPRPLVSLYAQQRNRSSQDLRTGAAATSVRATRPASVSVQQCDGDGAAAEAGPVSPRHCRRQFWSDGAVIDRRRLPAIQVAITDNRLPPRRSRSKWRGRDGWATSSAADAPRLDDSAIDASAVFRYAQRPGRDVAPPDGNKTPERLRVIPLLTM